MMRDRCDPMMTSGWAAKTRTRALSRGRRAMNFPESVAYLYNSDERLRWPRTKPWYETLVLISVHGFYPFSNLLAMLYGARGLSRYTPHWSHNPEPERTPGTRETAIQRAWLAEMHGG
jgi:hypothetical protein